MDTPSWMTLVEMGLLLLVVVGCTALALVYRQSIADWWVVWAQRGRAIELHRVTHLTTTDHTKHPATENHVKHSTTENLHADPEGIAGTNRICHLQGSQ